ncbi:peptidylprolyl isomerase [Pseudomonadales bacterium]|jgi:peptidyl-prolyl cis-trans isomerase B (cyclophilin B)|nr:peptidylprolyl isomerase [Gammaproteobacteria bacterium]MDA7726415.1 peptidylprolyl isomerase [Pseudomonadales bacterium]MDC1019117.1 peptidylprolyl isomerase [Pseudomonadales bacterium]|tara:strand:+ start:4306 stop:5820 length:1515 start_codon:yes stop_codon:yes gene_type:complete
MTNRIFNALQKKLPLISLLALLGLLSACSDSDDSEEVDSGPAPTPVNIRPAVSAGSNQTVTGGTVVSLSGEASDSDGSISNTQWVQSTGPDVTLSDDTTLTVSFTAPVVTTNTTLSFSLEARDNDGAATSDNITVTIVPNDNNRVLLGPLIGADVVVTRVGNSTETLETTTTSTTSDLETGGSFSLTLAGLPDNDWVLVTVTGGSDIDADDDNVIDATPTLNTGEIRALGTASDWRAGGTNVTALTEVAVRRLLDGDVNLDTLSTDSIEIQLTGLAFDLLQSDVNADAQIDYKDILAFTPAAAALLNPNTLTAAELNGIAQSLESANYTEIDTTLAAAFNFDTFATIDTNLGNMKFQLFRTLTPNTVINFTTHARNGFYDGLIFHRVIANFVIQGGDPNGNGTGGESILGGTFDDEFDESLSNVTGTLAMANSGPNTNTSQFFMNVIDNTGLDFDKAPLTSAHTVFGQLVEGSDILNAISNVATNTSDRPVTDVVIEAIVISRE